MIIIETAPQTDCLQIHADDIRFVLSTFFSHFSLCDNEQHRLLFQVISNVPQHTTARSRAPYILHIDVIYVAVYAEVQGRSNGYEEFCAALAALMFNVFQKLRTVLRGARMQWHVCPHYSAKMKMAVRTLEIQQLKLAKELFVQGREWWPR